MGKRITQQKRGRGSTKYTSPGFRSKGAAKSKFSKGQEVIEGVVLDFVSCPLHSAPLAQVEYNDGDKGLIIAPEGIQIGQKISVGGTDTSVGNCIQLKHIPEGTLVYNIELRPGDGGKFCRTTGAFARVASKQGDNDVVVLLPSKKKKVLIGDCRASIGVVAGGGRVDKPLLKAGTSFFKHKAKNKVWPITKGHSMSAVAHPFGNKRSSRKAKAKPAPHNAPPGRKVGMLRPKRSGRTKR